MTEPTDTAYDYDPPALDVWWGRRVDFTTGTSTPISYYTGDYTAPLTRWQRFKRWLQWS